MPKIRFVRNYEVQAADGEKYVIGDEREMCAASCEHFVSRGAAVYVKGRPSGTKARPRNEGPGAPDRAVADSSRPAPAGA